MGINFFSSKEDQKEFHRSLIKHKENSIQFLEGAIKFNRDMIENAKKCPLPGDKDRPKKYKTQLKEFEEDLRVQKEKLKQEKMKYDEKYLTISEKALKKGFTVIRGGAIQ